MNEDKSIQPSQNNSSASTQAGWIESMNMMTQPQQQVPMDGEKKSLDDIGDGLISLYKF